MRIKITNPMFVKQFWSGREFDVVQQTKLQYCVDSKNKKIGRLWFNHDEVTVLED
jgi:hypothetical protein